MDIWSLNWILLHYHTDSLCLYPQKSLIENIGFDGSGVHSEHTEIFNKKTEGIINTTFPDFIELNTELENQTNDFLFMESEKTMLLKKKEKQPIEEIVDKCLENIKLIDVHTHLYPKEFEKYHLSGIDELLTYHYLISELIQTKTISEEDFFKLEKKEQADLIWEELFLNRTPLSEATQGIITTLSELGINFRKKDLEEIRSQFQQINENQIFEKAKLKSVVMTNDPFDNNEMKFWNTNFNKERYLFAFRIDALFNESEQKIKKLIGDQKIENYLIELIKKYEPEYLAVSTSPNFKEIFANEAKKQIFNKIIKISKEMKTPIAFMVGVKRKTNKLLLSAGDSVGKSDLTIIEKICRENRENEFFVTALSRENQHELIVLTRKFPNLTIFGCWWFLNTPHLIEEITKMRLDLLGIDFIPQHSDSRILEQLVYKWIHSKKIIKKVLVEKYSKLISSGWIVNEFDVSKDLELLFNKRYKNIVGK